MEHNSFLAKVLGSNFKELHGYDVIDTIDKVLKSRGTELNTYQKEVLRDEWSGEYGRLPFEAFVWGRDKEKKVSLLWRLSAIPLGIWLVLLFIFMPVKWLITGSPYYTSKRNKDGKHTVGSFTAAWINKVKK